MNFKILGVVLLFLCNCSREKAAVSPLLDYVPKEAAVLIRINDDGAFKSELKNNGFIQQISKTGIYGNILEKVKGLEYLTPKTESLLVFVEEGKEIFELLYITKNDPEILALDSLANKTIETLTYQSAKISKYTLDGSLFFSTQLDGNLLISTSQMVLENLIRNSGNFRPNHKLQKMLSIEDASKSANFIVHAENSNSLLSAILKGGKSMDLGKKTDYVALDMDAGQEQLHLGGIAMANDSVKSMVHLFKNTAPLHNSTAGIAPLSAHGILSFTFEDYETFAKNQRHYLDKSTVMDTLFKGVEELGYIFMNNTKAIMLNTTNSGNLSGFLIGLQKSTLDYQGNEISELNDNTLLNTFFNPVIQDFDANFYTILENSFVFAPAQEILQTIISNYKNNATFNQTNIYKSAMAELADESNVLLVANAEGIAQMMETHFANNVLDDLKKAELKEYSFAFQVISDAGFYHTHTVIKKMEKENRVNTVSPLFSVQLDAELATVPQFVTNHRTGKKEIVVQDRENNLYLISTEGKVLWKKQLTGKVQGRIAQVDIYKNGRLQLAFTTDRQFLILDRNGEEVKPFSKTYEGELLNPLAVFDYDQNKDYRFVVVQGKKLMMYNNKGEIVKGFTYTTSESPVLGTPKHFRSGRRDYLVFKEASGQLKILDRTGKIRIKVSENIDFSDNEVLFYKDAFTITDTQGTLYQIAENGKLTATPLKLLKDHGIDATTQTLAVMNDNLLKIKDKEVTLELGLYTKPKVFLLNNKIYVTVTDLQNQKIYLFDSNAVSLPNFPVLGSSVMDLADMDMDGKQELVVKDLDNSLLVYKMY